MEPVTSYDFLLVQARHLAGQCGRMQAYIDLAIQMLERLDGAGEALALLQQAHEDSRKSVLPS